MSALEGAAVTAAMVAVGWAIRRWWQSDKAWSLAMVASVVSCLMALGLAMNESFVWAAIFAAMSYGYWRVGMQAKELGRGLGSR